MNTYPKILWNIFSVWKLQANVQQRVERERKELEQGHVRIVKEYETKVRDLDASNRVCSTQRRSIFSC